MILLTLRDNTASATSRPSTTTSGALPTELSRALVSTVLSPFYALAKLVPSYASMLHGLRATVGTGITCSNYAAWSKPASLTMTASTIRVDPTIGCCWE
ncbi:hypothetical protein FA04_25160 (plasmid) [Ensifer adhaerens]|nr:hypothetical protein FA04_24230 [Ensifer adhaerens]ANK75935.1 hypothetical protein FA04_25160 [Ensifer adhaerens]KDP70901.1 hypothetical protein FA04_25875 [Ensifer adhaerens]KDP71160.1 hypothetical protein FA04_24500 [Ensifer adhaerens]